MEKRFPELPLSCLTFRAFYSPVNPVRFNRLEITGADRVTLDWLRSLGCFTEIHQFTLRVFVPFGENIDTTAILANIMGQGEMELAA